MVSLPINERQVRPLTDLPDDQQADAWKEAVDTALNGKVTAKHVQAVVERRIPRKERPMEKLKDSRVYVCLDYEDAEWSAQELVHALSGHVEFVAELISCLEDITEGASA